MTPIMIDEMVQDFTLQEHQTAISRALMQIEVPIAWDLNDEEELVLAILSDDDDDRSIEDYFENDEFLTALDAQYKSMCAAFVMDQLTEDGTVEATGINEDGTVEYVLAPVVV